METLLSPTHGQRDQQQSGQITLQSVLINKTKFQSHTLYIIRKIELPRSIVVETLSWLSRRTSHHPAVRTPCIPEKRPTNVARSPLLVDPRRMKTDRAQRSYFPSGTSRFTTLILAQRCSALPWLVDDRAALRPRRIWCVLARYTRLSVAMRPASRVPPPSEGHQTGARKRRTW